jgi:hypothetical protein
MDKEGALVLRYGDLVVEDGAGEDVPAELVCLEGRLQIRIDDRSASYPLLVDPLVTLPSWQQEGNQANCQFGFSVATAGDVNGDGYSDVLIGAPAYDNPGESPGRAFLYVGGAGGPALNVSWSARLGALGGLGEFGESVAAAGDLNGDGYGDIIIGAPEFSDDSHTSEGHAYVWHGGPPGGDNGVSGLGPNGTAANADWEADADRAQAILGRSVAAAGDVNGDGYDDVVIGSPGYNDGQADEGWAFVWFGGAGGLGADGTPANADWSAQSDAAAAAFGWSVSGAGDVNADGYDDVLIGSPGLDYAFVWLGAGSGLGANGTPFNADWSANGGQGSFGKSVATAGDVNGDGYSDVIVGAPTYTNGSAGEGAAFLWLGSSADLGANGNPVNADWSREGNQANAEFGWAVATAGDVNGDGFADVLVGAHLYDNGQNNEGRVYAYAGSGGGLLTASFWTAEGNVAGSNFGQSVATAGDVNGDGYSDALVGAWLYTGNNGVEGAAYAYFGSAGVPELTAAWVYQGDQSGARYGYSVASAGDVNGDGYGDVIVGAPNYNGGSSSEGKVFVYAGQPTGPTVTPIWTAESNQANAVFGISVASAGDVNGDGYGDVIVGASQYDQDGLGDEGWTFVWLGSASGLGSSGTPGNADWSARGNQAAARFGMSVAGAGDVNGDGYGDVIVGAPTYANGQVQEGRAYVFHGSASGLHSAPDWIEERDQATENFGTSVATAGDVNGDGYSDVIVGAPLYDGSHVDEGRAWVYLGSSSGVSASAVWFADLDQTGAGLGQSVATAGDVNGDGYSDVIVGAFRYDNPEADEGRAYVYYGNAGGLEDTPAWTAESDDAGADFGWVVAGAGDVNNDGFGDVIVGAPLYDGAVANSGKAFLWLGSGTGLGANGTPGNADWSDDGSQGGAQGANFGISVASAGDVNGDGFGDLMAGAFLYTDPSNEEGAAFYFYGNGGNCMDRAARQARSDDLAPVSLLGFSDSETSFRLKARGRTVSGRGRVRLEWEVKPLAAPFDGTALGRSPSPFDTGTPGTQGSVVAMNDVVAGLTTDTVYKWRVRVATDSPLFPHGPWLSLAYNGRTETDIRTTSRVSGVSSPAACAPSRLRCRNNPFSGGVEIFFTLPAAGRVRLEIVDVAGRRVSTLLGGTESGGEHSVMWAGDREDGTAVSAGVYFVRLTAGASQRVEKIVKLE